ncbi:MAG: DUF1549 domain-containing protein [Myxococcota bacterium]
MRRPLSIGFATLLALAAALPGCGDPSPQDAAADGDADGGSDDAGGEPVARLDPAVQLLRASMAIRGTHPTLAEFERVAADPDALEALVDEYLQSPEFGETVKDMWSEQLRTRQDITKATALAPAGPLAPWTERFDRINEAVADAPLRMIERIFLEDRPVTEMVTSETILANRVLAAAFDIPWEGGASDDEWIETTWGDGRPTAGLLSHSSLWHRWVTMDTNANRTRANLISSTFLCVDFSSANVPIDGNVDLSDHEAIADAVNNDPACVSCHEPLDPLAAHLSIFKALYRREYTAAFGPSGDGEHPPMFLPERADEWQDTGLRGPGYFGKPSESLEDLGQHIAADPRFADCVARTVYAYLAQMERDAVPSELVAEYRDVLIEAEYRPRALVRRFALSDEYQAENDEGTSARIGLLAARPEQYARTIADLTGFRWLIRHEGVSCSAGVSGCKAIADLSLVDRAGFRAMAGGIDSALVTEPVYSPMPVRSLVVNALANEAAAFVVSRDLGQGPGEGQPLLDLVDASESSEAAIRAQLVPLHLRLYGETVGPGSEAVDLSWALFEAALREKSGAVQEAWIVTLSAMLQDPHLTFY